MRLYMIITLLLTTRYTDFDPHSLVDELTWDGRTTTDQRLLSTEAPLLGGSRRLVLSAFWVFSTSVGSPSDGIEDESRHLTE